MAHMDIKQIKQRLIMEYGNETPNTASGDWYEQMMHYVEEKRRQGQTGVKIPRGFDTKEAKKDVIDTKYKDLWMGEKVAELGHKISKRNKTLQPADWAAWMMNTKIVGDEKGVTVYCKNRFHREMVSQKIGFYLKSYFNTHVVYAVHTVCNDVIKEKYSLA